MRTGALLAAVVVACLCVQRHVQAAPITFQVTATVSFLQGPAAIGNVLPSVEPGQSITGLFTFEGLVPDANPGDPTEGLYPVSGLPYGMTFSVGGVTFSSDAISMVIRNNAVGGLYDEYIAHFSPASPFSTTNASPPPTASSDFSIQLALASTNNLLYSSDALPTEVPDLSSFDFSRTFSLNFFDLAGNFGVVEGNVTSVTQVPEPATMILVDIRPGSDTNPINLRSKGLIPVAILSTAAFDATSVDPISVRFGPAGATAFKERGHFEDADGDGAIDLVLHFRTQDTGIASGTTTACLTAQSFGGAKIQGCDAVTVR